MTHTRRGVLGALLSLPLVGKVLEAKPPTPKPEPVCPHDPEDYVRRCQLMGFDGQPRSPLTFRCKCGYEGSVPAEGDGPNLPILGRLQ